MFGGKFPFLARKIPNIEKERYHLIGHCHTEPLATGEWADEKIGSGKAKTKTFTFV